MMNRIFSTILFFSLFSLSAYAQVSIENQRKACANGNGEACNRLGNMYATGNGVEKSRERMLEYFGKACDMKNQQICKFYEIYQGCHSGNGEACHNLGTMYQEAYGVKQSRERALEYFTKGCDLANRPACRAYKKLKDQKTQG